jgi:hypothetical protein
MDDGGDIVEVQDFDVLADELPGTVYVVDDYDKQIGNNRFEVLIQMYQEGYNMNYTNNNMKECETIVQKIIDVTCHKQSASSHHRGRFLVKAMHERHWRELNDEQSKEFVKQQLRATTIDEIHDPDPFATDHDYILYGIGCDPDEDTYEPLPVSSNIDFNNSDIPSLDFGNMELNDKKRGRRSSLLRRSVSESTLLVDKKKTFKDISGELSLLISDSNSPPDKASGTERFHQNIADPSSWTAPMPGKLHRYNTVGDPSTHPSSFCAYRLRANDRSPTKSSSDAGPAASRNIHRSPVRSTALTATNYTTTGATVPTYIGMDVVLASDCKSLSSKRDIVGNNRLKVLLNLQSQQYSHLTSDGQTKMAVDLVTAVTENWKGRILADKGFSYVILTHNEAIDSMRYLLTPHADSFASSKTPSKSPYDHVESNSILKNESLSTPSSSAMAQAKTTLLSSAPPVPDFLRNASREILEAGKNRHHLLGPEQMQSAAVRSIKERAGKRQLAKGLGSGRNLSAGTAVASTAEKQEEP